jgi:hypothetical protein
MEIEDKLQNLILQQYENPHENETCTCGLGNRLVKCKSDGCFQYQTSCKECFVARHRHNPFHWALVWDMTKRIWVKTDYSTLSEDAYIQLGHLDDQRACPGTKTSNPLMVTHINGIHVTQIRFCGCIGAPDKISQLMLAELFPATPTDPRSAFTFTVLKHFHMHNLQSKCGAFDYILSLRRLTDNVFTSKVSVSKDQ